MKEFVALAKTQPGKINYASGGAGQSSHMAMELFKLVAEMDVTHVPYKGAGPGMTAMVAGEVGAMFAGDTCRGAAHQGEAGCARWPWVADNALHRSPRRPR